MKSSANFTGFNAKSFQFLRGLKRNNKREWFQSRKGAFEAELQVPLRALIEGAAALAAKAKLPVTGSAKKSLFRIYRDARFSRNKDPYKTHVSAVLTRDGGKKDHGVVYVHIEPGNCFLAAGFWMPDPRLLALWRLQIADDPAAFKRVAQKLTKQKLPFDPEGELKRMPRGFERHQDAAFADWLKLKSFIVVKEVPDAKVLRGAFAKEVVSFAKQSLPLLEYGWDVVDTWRAQGGDRKPGEFER